jgi:glycosyltransferase involved in cell wall biosynthesis
MSATTERTPSSLPDTPVRKIRVLHLIHSMAIGGIETTVLNWVRFLDTDRCEFFVCCFAGDRGREYPFLEAAAAAAVGPIYTIPWRRSKPVFRAARALARHVRDLQIDIVHTHSYYANVVGAAFRLLQRDIPVVGTLYVWGHYDPLRMMLQFTDWCAMRFIYDGVTAHCENTVKQTLRLGFTEEEVALTISGVPAHERPSSPEERARLRRKAGLGDDELLLVNLARIYPEKAHDQLLQSFKIIHDRIPRARLWIAGTGLPQLQAKLSALQSQLGLDGAASFIGFRSDVARILQMADIMVHPSHVEGVPLTILHGMTAGLPIVASDVGGVADVIKHGKTGVLVQENDVDGFASAVIGLAQSEPERRRLGHNALEFAVSEQSMATASRQLGAVYSKLLARRTGAA